MGESVVELAEFERRGQAYAPGDRGTCRGPEIYDPEGDGGFSTMNAPTPAGLYQMRHHLSFARSDAKLAAPCRVNGRELHFGPLSGPKIQSMPGFVAFRDEPV